MMRGRPHHDINMETSFLSLVEHRWNTLRRASSCALMRSQASRPSAAALLIEVEMSEANATIMASECSRTLSIVVRRSRHEQVLFDGPCATDAALDRGLNALCTDLSASPRVQ